MEFETRAIHRGEEPNFEASGDVVVPIHLASTFARRKVDEPTAGYEYSRSGNPTRTALEKRLAALENAEHALAFSSGLAATTVLGLTLLKPGDHVVAFDDLYGGIRRLFNAVFHKNFGVDFSFVDASHTENVASSIRPNTRLVWVETPSNPLMKECDIAAIAEIIKNSGQAILFAVDNTFMTPYYQKPLELGADIVVHSTTKYIGGHSDSIGGAIILNSGKETHLFNIAPAQCAQLQSGALEQDLRAVFVANGKPLSYRLDIKATERGWHIADQSNGQSYNVTREGAVYAGLYQEFKFNQNSTGAILSPFDCYLVLRGTKTLAVRMDKHTENARVLAEHLRIHPKVEKIRYAGKGGMISFEIKGEAEDAKRFLEQMEVFALAESLGGVESLIEHPSSMTHAFLSREDREEIGLRDSLIRISVGIENVEDLRVDLDRGLQVL